MRRVLKPRMEPIDYLFLFGGPILFFLIAWFGLRAVIGPIPPPNPIARLRAGEVKIGMTSDQVMNRVGPPKSETPRPDGGFTYRYQRGTAEPFVEEDAYVDFGASGFVIGISFEKTSISPPGAAESP